MYRSKKNKSWLNKHINDYFFKKSKLEGYNSRSVYKLKEIDEKELLIKKNMNILDLGSFPGGWTQYVYSKLCGTGKIVSVDVISMKMKNMKNFRFIHGNVLDNTILKKIIDIFPNNIDLLLSDISPNIVGIPTIDMPKIIQLSKHIITFSKKILTINGTLLIKVFYGNGFHEIVDIARKIFNTVKIKKPLASFSHSRENYLLAKNLIN